MVRRFPLLVCLGLVLLAPVVAASGSSDSELTVVEPEKLGFSSEQLGRIVPAIKRFIDDGKIPGTVTLVARLEHRTSKPRSVEH